MQSLLNKLILFIFVVIQVLALNRGDELEIFKGSFKSFSKLK